MTNAEKFKEVFGFKPDKEEMLPICKDNCPYSDDDGCHCERWWDEEYKGDTPPFITEKVGHWIKIDDCSNSGYYCSECRKRVVKEGWSDTVKIIKYCPNCGSRMMQEVKKNEQNT